MTRPLPASFRTVLAAQAGVFRTAQATRSGLTAGDVEAQVTARRWRRLSVGVLVAHNGPLSPAARLWQVVCAHQPDAVLSHDTAAYLQGLIDREPPAVHVTVAAARRLAARPGVVLHRTRRELAAAPGRRPPQTLPADTAFDLADTTGSVEAVVALVTRCLQRNLASRATILAALAQRSRARWRGLLEELLADEAHGLESALEWRFDRDVLRAHGLPAMTRQQVVVRSGRVERRDGWFAGYGVCVELDGRQGHVGDGAFKDMRRDNAAAARGEVALRYGWHDTYARPCESAGQLAAVLRRRGWRGRLRRCGPDCRVTDVAA